MRQNRPASPRPTRSNAPARRSIAALMAIPAFAVLYGLMQLVWQPPRAIALVYLVASVVTFVAYAIDKAAAVRGTWRTPEKTLHTLALVGGWPGALLAQQWLRHKSSKTEFRVAFWLTVAINVLGFVWVCSPWGAAQLQR